MDAREFGAQVDDLEKKVERLRALYEQYFMGIERTEPGVLRNEVERQFRALRRERCTNTAQRFRFQTLIQRYTTLAAYWQRVCRAIEEGTYQPHVLRAERRIARESALEPAAAARRARGIRDVTNLVELDSDHETGQPPASAPPPPPSASIPPPLPGVKRARSLEELKRLLEASGSEAPPADVPSDGVGGGPPARSERPPDPVAERAPASSPEGRPPDSPRASPPVPPAARPSALPVKPPASPAGAEPSAVPGPQAAGTPPSKPGPAPVRPAQPRTASPAAVSPPPASGAGFVSEEKVRAIHAAFAAAAQGKPAPSPAAIRKSLEQEFERMSKKYPGRRVDFRVDLKDGKPVIKSFVS